MGFTGELSDVVLHVAPLFNRKKSHLTEDGQGEKGAEKNSAHFI
jgi:hypothetical protein